MTLRNVWRIGTNWGGQPILDVFFDYGVAFFYKDQGKFENYIDAKPGDLLAITNPSSYTIVAIAEMLTSFMPLNQLGILFSQTICEAYGDECTMGCRAKLFILAKEERHNCSDYKRFYSMRQNEKVNELYTNYCKREERRDFGITPKTKTLFNGSDILFSENIRYRIPIYQRPYSWGENEISKLIEDICTGAEKDEKKFIGTMQVSVPIPLDADGKKVAYDVIDGQQRITTLLLIIRVLQLKWGLFTDIDTSELLRTTVNRGEAQKELDSLCKLNLDELNRTEMANIYCRNARTILSLLIEKLSSETDSPETGTHLNPECLEKYLKERIVLVVIETDAGLSKTLEIFNIINTTGLDLNGADIFKIRFYEFLTDKRKCDGNEDVFYKISKLYEIIEKRNKDGYIQSSMPEVLTILQPMIVGKYELPLELMVYASDRFFSELFDSLIGSKQWQSFNEDKVKIIVSDTEGPLSINGIMKLIEARYEYGVMTEMPTTVLQDIHGYPTLSSSFMHTMMFYSRYPRYWFYPIIFKYCFAEYGEFREELLKLVLVYSLTHKKSIYEIHSCIQKACIEMFKDNIAPESVVNMLKQKRLEAKNVCENALKNNEIAGTTKWKNIICRLSEFLMYSQSEQEIPNRDVYERLFWKGVDIEHIQSYNDKDNKLRDDIWQKWGEKINGIGNLTILESSINRSISNEVFSEKTNSKRNWSYHNSEFKCVLNLAELSEWSLEQCNKRINDETGKIMKFLFAAAVSMPLS